MQILTKLKQVEKLDKVNCCDRGNLGSYIFWGGEGNYHVISQLNFCSGPMRLLENKEVLALVEEDKRSN